MGRHGVPGSLPRQALQLFEIIRSITVTVHAEEQEEGGSKGEARGKGWQHGRKVQYQKKKVSPNWLEFSLNLFFFPRSVDAWPIARATRCSTTLCRALPSAALGGAMACEHCLHFHENTPAPPRQGWRPRLEKGPEEGGVLRNRGRLRAAVSDVMKKMARRCLVSGAWADGPHSERLPCCCRCCCCCWRR